MRVTITLQCSVNGTRTEKVYNYEGLKRLPAICRAVNDLRFDTLTMTDDVVDIRTTK